MADNTELNLGSGGDKAATKDVTHGGESAKLQVVNIVGVSGTEGSYTIADIDGTAANGLEVDVTRVQGTVTVDGSGVTQPVSAAALPLPSGAATAANQLTDGHNVTIDNASGDAVYVRSDNTVSANNSTTTPLAGDAVFTGTGDDCLEYASVTITLDSSHDSATDGMTFQFSTDNSNWDDVYTFTYTAADGARRFQYAITARYFRIVYTNGSTLQTHFRVQTILHRSNVLTSIHRLVNNTDPDRSAQLIKAAIIAQAAGSGDFVPVQTTAGGNFKVSVQEFSDGVDVGNGAVGSETLRVTIASDTTGVLSVDDNGASLTVDGTVTANLSATDNAVLDQIELNTSYGDSVGGGTEAAALRVTIANDSTGLVSVDDGGGALTVDGTVTANAGSGTFTVDGSGVTQPVSGTVTANLSATDNAVLDQIEVNTSYGDSVGGGTEAAALRVTIANDSTGVLSVDDGGGILTVDGTVSVDLNAGTNTNEVVGDVAHDAAAAGNPLLIAGAAQDNDDTAPPNRVSTEGDATRLATDFDGSLHVRPHGPQLWSYHVNGSSALTDASVHAAPGANLSLYVTDIVFSSGAATAINMFFEESTTTVLGPYYLEATAGRGMSVHFQTPKKITANTALTVTTSAAIAHSIDVTGYIGQG